MKDRFQISNIAARSIFDSRGLRTVEVDVTLGQHFGRASVASGKSLGNNEAFELRDDTGDVQAALKMIREIIRPHLLTKYYNQVELDEALIKLDGTENKAVLGGNVMIAISIAFAKAAATALSMPFYSALRQWFDYPKEVLRTTPMLNVINGGLHSDNALDLQEFMIVPEGTTFRDKINKGAQVIQTLKQLLIEKGLSIAVGDEGGFAPQLQSSRSALDLISQAISLAGHKVTIALDAAASVFYRDNKYHLIGEGLCLDSKGLIEYYQGLSAEYQLVSIEDPMSEDDEEGWKMISSNMQAMQLAGDDLFVTNRARLEHGAKLKLGNAIIIKPNQVGTLTETMDTISTAKKHGYVTIISHRSGETEDTFISHIAAAVNSQYIKAGSLCRGERTAKYNELLRIEEECSTGA